MPEIKIGVNFIKIVVGVVFSLIWGQVMYLVWPQPSYLVFVLFYLIAGSVIIKWVFFEIIDRVSLRARLKAISQEIDESGLRVHEAIESSYAEKEMEIRKDSLVEIEGFNRKLRMLEQETLSFGKTVRTAMAQAVLSLDENDTSLASAVIDHDSEIDRRRYVMENDCMQLIRTGLASEKDLRKLLSMLNIVNELERMADYAEGIAKITLMLGKDIHLKPPVEFQQMANRALTMLESSLESFRDSDAEKARYVSGQDDQVDRLYDQVFRNLVVLMIKQPGDITKITWLVWAAHNLERFADRVTNICERVVFSASGKITGVKISKY
ncbi:MAG: phosphate signaling complex protein PhoU [Dehalococcoidales bacterium]|nr:phosphate signaling complex protein PhoU [Dehalococcoidales bacterium]